MDGAGVEEMKEITHEDWIKNQTPRFMWCWNDDEADKVKLYVVCVLSKEECDVCGVTFPIRALYSCAKHCAELEETKKIRMTNYELAKWLYEGASCGEFREYKCEEYVHHYYSYSTDGENIPCPDNILIRSNGGEWHAPLVEVEE